MDSGKVASSLVQCRIDSTYALHYTRCMYNEPGVLNADTVEITFYFPR